jgi:hypothetical protein
VENKISQNIKPISSSVQLQLVLPGHLEDGEPEAWDSARVSHHVLLASVVVDLSDPLLVLTVRVGQGKGSLLIRRLVLALIWGREVEL